MGLSWWRKWKTMGKMVRDEIRDLEVWLEGGGRGFMGNWKARRRRNDRNNGM